MQELARQRCFNHLQREAAARCPLCRRFFCRECVTEHEDQVLCASCLARKSRDISQGGRVPRLWLTLQFTVGAFSLWFFFYLLGRLLLKLPTSFHDGTIWKNGLM
jgi:hypothetical protein